MNRLAGALALGCALMSATLARAETVSAEGGDIWYEACGSGPKTLLLMHDGLLHSAGFDAVWPELCKRYRVIRYDRRGYGRTPEAKADYSGSDDAMAVLKAAGAAKATVLGASNGGAGALSLTLTHPEAVEKLILVGAAFGLPPSEFGQDLAKKVGGVLRRQGIAAAIEQQGYAALSPEGRTAAADLLAANPQNITHKERRRPIPPLQPRLGQIKAPTLLLIGAGDSPDNQASTGALEVLVPGAKRVVIGGAGHFIYLDQPKAFLAEVEGFLK